MFSFIRTSLICLLFCILNFSYSSANSAPQDKPAYLIYKSDGTIVNWQTFVSECLKHEIVFFGEHHNNPIHHWLQLELIKELHQQKNGKITIGAEMFESDIQLIIDEYLSGIIRERNFREEARLWNNYQTDYRPIVEFAKENSIKFIATNIPRRYAAMINQDGFEALDKLQAEALKFIPTLPIPFDQNLNCYSEIINMPMMAHSKTSSSLNTAKAQAIKDATMAWFILKNLSSNNIFIHLNGSFHTDNYEGIVWYINHYVNILYENKSIKQLVISVAEEENISTPNINDFPKADFIILTPKSLIKTH